MQMALLSSTFCNPLVFSKNPKPLPLSTKFSTCTFFPFSLATPTFTHLNFTSLRLRSSTLGGIPDPISEDDPGKDDGDKPFDGPPSKIADEWGEESEPAPEASNNFTSLRSRSSTLGGIPDPISEDDPGKDDGDKPFDKPPSKIADEWGEESEPEPEESITKLPDSDPPKYEDEWEEGGAEGEKIEGGNRSPATAVNVGTQRSDIGCEGLKRALVDAVHGTDFGFRASAEVRAEVSELVAQLEAANPTPAPVEASGFNGNWVLLYTASSELLLLLAAGTTPLLKVEEILQTIDTSSSTIVNSTTFSSPFTYLSFSASATFEVRSPARIQVIFKEAAIQPPEIKSRIELPENVNIFGQNLNLSPVQQSLSRLQDVVDGISHAISGRPPLKIPIPDERTSSWLIVTYLDDDLRISRGDGDLFILAREGSSLLDQ